MNSYPKTKLHLLLGIGIFVFWGWALQALEPLIGTLAYTVVVILIWLFTAPKILSLLELWDSRLREKNKRKREIKQAKTIILRDKYGNEWEISNEK